MTEIVKNVLQTDIQNRQKGVKGGLYKLSSLKTKQWDYSLPTIVKINDFSKDLLKGLNTSGFRKKFKEKFTAILDLDFKNILIAGGCIGNFIIGKEINDIDIFLYGLTKEEATKKVKEICQIIVDNLKHQHVTLHNESKWNKTKISIDDVTEKQLNIQYRRTKNCLNIGNYQIIFRIYKTKSEILHGFDIGSSAIGFDGKDILFTELSKFSYEYGANIIDTTRRSTTYEKRLRKYFDRGFDIIMPKFDPSKVDGRLWQKYNIPEVCEMPYFVFTYKTNGGNKLILSRWYSDVEKQQMFSDYDEEEVEEYVNFYRNIQFLIAEEYDKVIYTNCEYESIIENPECFTKSKIDYFYDQVYEKVTTSPQFPTRWVTNYLSIVTPEEVFANRNDKEWIKKVVDEQREFIYNRVEMLKKNDTGISWITDNPGTQLTSSYNPIIEDEGEWYGKFYLDPGVGTYDPQLRKGKPYY